MARDIHRIYAALDNKYVENPSNMFEVDIYNQPISILIDLVEIHSYISPSMVEIFYLKKINHDKSWLV